VDADGYEYRHGVRVIAKVAPARGRLFAFPHECPHEGRAVINAPKLLLRGELY
jgi:nitrite reductase/ring-hydroxylating ferredoxin subunit